MGRVCILPGLQRCLEGKRFPYSLCFLSTEPVTKHFRDFSEPGYQLRDAPPIEPSGLTGPSLPISTVSFRNPRSATDQKSIFVGNLPADTSEHELADHFKKYGEIKACNVIRKPILGTKRSHLLLLKY